MNWHSIGDGLAMDWHRIVNELMSRQCGLAATHLCIGIGLAMDWHRIGTGLALDWQWIDIRLVTQIRIGIILGFDWHLIDS